MSQLNVVGIPLFQPVVVLEPSEWQQVYQLIISHFTNTEICGKSRDGVRTNHQLGGQKELMQSILRARKWREVTT